MSSIPLVLFSGGLDSTYMLSLLLQDGPVDVLYVNGGQCKNKIKKEMEARDKLIKLMNEIYPHKIQGQYEVLDPVYLHSGDDKKWTQPNAWMQGAYRVLKPTRHSCIKLAYVADDGLAFGYHLPKMEQQWKLTQEIGYAGTPVPMEFPLMHNTKLEILELIDKRLLEHVWVCEIPVDEKACGNCNPCKLINRTLLEYKLKHGETVWLTAKRAIRGFKKSDPVETRTWTNVPYHCHDSSFYEYLSGDPGGKKDEV